MSSLVTLQIPKQIKNEHIFKQLLETYQHSFSGGKYLLFVDGFRLEFTVKDGVIAVTYDTDYKVQATKTIDEILSKYDKLYEQAIEDMRKNIAAKREATLLGVVKKEEVDAEISQMNRELKKMEKIKRSEEKLQREQIDKVKNEILERAKAGGFTVQITQKEQKQIIRLVRQR